jgi:hypothetical protein
VTAAEILLSRDPAPLLDGQETIPVTADETDDPDEEP